MLLILLLNIFKLVGGSTAHVMMNNILKKAVLNFIATKYSWAGKRDKLSFKDLNLVKIIAQAVRMVHGQVTDPEIASSISKWLAQSTLRTQRKNVCSRYSLKIC
ncbi:hypothetical protein PUN28_008188 [Cardiocondyla obscurior]|uniref:DUF4806 domain-containing protein n=1 Tax=Cardiocondyla obscurior TaxID=286306 RepID=A0AAW2FZP8_9HYME